MPDEIPQIVMRGHRAKAALATAKAQGVRLGQPKNREAEQVLGRQRQMDRAQGRAVDLAPVIAEARASGATSLRDIAATLNAGGVPTARGGTW